MSDNAQAPVIAKRWIILLVLFLARTAMEYQFQTVGALGPILVDALKIDFVWLGTLILTKETLAMLKVLRALPRTMATFFFSPMSPGMLCRSSRRALNAPAAFIYPCQPIVAKQPPSGLGWAHELKHDGYRLQILCVATFSGTSMLPK